MVLDEDFKPKPASRGGKNNTAYSYFVNACKEEHRRRFPGEQLPQAEFTRKCVDRWKIMSEREKKYFNIQAESGDRKKDASYSRTPALENKRGRKPRSKKDPNAPKRPLGPYFLFMVGRTDTDISFDFFYTDDLGSRGLCEGNECMEVCASP